MKRRDFIKLAAASGSLLAMPSWGYYDEIAQWKTFRFNYHVALPEGADAKLWLPIPDSNDTLFQRNMGSVWSDGPTKASLFDPPKNPAALFFGEWPRTGSRDITVGTLIKTANRRANLDIASDGNVPREFRHYVTNQPAIVKKTAASIIQGKDSSLAKAKAIYDWVVTNTHYDASVPGCGTGDPAAWLEGASLGGKSLDIATLFVSLCSASHIPARGAYGILLKEGEHGKIDTEYHARAEFYLEGPGWVPVDPAEIQRVIQEEGKSFADAGVAQLKEALFGSWKLNWIGLNHERNIALPNSGGHLPLFIYPRAEVGGKMLDGAELSYRIEVNEMVGTGIHFS